MPGDLWARPPPAVALMFAARGLRFQGSSLTCVQHVQVCKLPGQLADLLGIGIAGLAHFVKGRSQASAFLPREAECFVDDHASHCLALTGSQYPCLLGI